MTTNTTYPLNATNIILESIADGVFTVDHQWRITTFNRAAEEITGVNRTEAIGRYCWEVFRSNMCERDCALKRTMAEGKPFVSSSTSIITSERREIPISVSTSLLKSENGDILGGVEVFRDHSLVEELRRELEGIATCGDMVSNSADMLDLFGKVEQIAQSDSTVLIDGETGTGKELLARALHYHSLRREKPFIGVNCGALPDNLLESELFGYRAGAFTDARRDKIGIFHQAEHGTVLLDEIGETSQAFQVKLLRFLEDQSFMPLGATRPEQTDVRIIAATNRNLSEMVGTNSFRKDLFYRINIIQLRLPPLRERKEDIPILVERFIEKLNRRKGRSIETIDDDARALLIAHDYPGNIRELENIIEHGFILCSNSVIKPHHLPGYLGQTEPAAAPGKPPIGFAEAERDVLLQTLQDNNYNRSATAQALNIHPSTLFRKIRKYQLHLPSIDGRFSGDSPE